MRIILYILPAILAAAQLHADAPSSRKMRDWELNASKNVLSGMTASHKSLQNNEKKWLERELRNNRDNHERHAILKQLEVKNAAFLEFLNRAIKDSETAIASGTYSDYCKIQTDSLIRELFLAEIDLIKTDFHRAGSLQHRQNLCLKYRDDPAKSELAKKILELEIDSWELELEARRDIVRSREHRLEAWKIRGTEVPTLENMLEGK